MVWGRVHAELYGSIKWLRASKGARALWCTSLSWCMAQLNDGYVPAEMLRVLDGSARDAASLVDVGLWHIAPGGWQFHDWSDWQDPAEDILRERKRKADNQRAYRERNRSGDQGVTGHVTGESPRKSRGEESREEEVLVPAAPNGGSRASTTAAGAGTATTLLLLSGHGLDESQRDAFLAHLSAAGVRAPSVLVARLHQSGDLARRIDQWRIDTKAATNARAAPTGKRTTDDRVRDGLNLAARLAAEDAQVIPIRQIGDGA